MPSKYPSGLSDLHDLIVEGLGYKASQTTATELFNDFDRMLCFLWVYVHHVILLMT